MAPDFRTAIGAADAIAWVGGGILGAIGPDGAGRAITLGDASAVKAAPGVGPKLAQRIVNELKGKAPALMALSGGAAAVVAEAGDAPGSRARPAKAPDDGPAKARAAARADAMSALVNLGYGEGEAAQAVATVETEREAEGETDSAGLIHAALKALARDR